MRVVASLICVATAAGACDPGVTPLPPGARAVTGLDACVLRLPGHHYVAALLPWEGNWPVGDPIAHAVIQALDEINAQGGIDARSIGVVFCNTRSDEQLTMARMEELSGAAPISAVIGPLRSSEAVAAAAVAGARGLPFISPSALVGPLAGIGADWIGDTAPSIAQEARLLTMVAEREGLRDLLVIHPADPQGTQLGLAVVAEFGAAGNLARAYGYTPQAADLGFSAVSVALFIDPRVVYLSAPPSEAAEILKAADNRAFTPRWIFGPQLRTARFIESVGNDAFLETARGIAANYPRAPDITLFATRYEAQWGQAPDPYVANAYDATYAAVAAMALSDDPDDRTEVKGNFQNLSSGVSVAPGDWGGVLAQVPAGQLAYHGIAGPLEFNGALGIAGGFEEWTIDRGEIVSGQCWTASLTPCP